MCGVAGPGFGRHSAAGLRQVCARSLKGGGECGLAGCMRGMPVGLGLAHLLLAHLLLAHWLSPRLAQAATCPPPAVPGVAAGDHSYDAGRTGEVLDAIATGALPELEGGDPRPVSHEAAVLWTRRWQLECAVRGGHAAAPDAILDEIAREAAELLHPGQPPMAGHPLRLDWHPALPPHALPRHIPRPGAFYAGGGVALGAGLAFLAGTITLGVEVAGWRPPPPCGSDAWLCLNGLDYTIHDIQIAMTVGLGILGTAATVTGAVLLQRGAHFARERRVQPTANGLRISF
jgi:hypothetical protein